MAVAGDAGDDGIAAVEGEMAGGGGVAAVAVGPAAAVVVVVAAAAVQNQNSRGMACKAVVGWSLLTWSAQTPGRKEGREPERNNTNQQKRRRKKRKKTKGGGEIGVA